MGFAQVVERLEAYYRIYHGALSRELASQRAMFGQVRAPVSGPQSLQGSTERNKEAIAPPPPPLLASPRLLSPSCWTPTR